MGNVEPVDSDRAGTMRPANGVGVGMPGWLHLNAFGRELWDAFDDHAYLVGSAATSKGWRDIDVRIMLDDERFDAMFPGHGKPDHVDPWWALICAALSELGRKRTGLPIDLQVQRASDANEMYGGLKRVALGIHCREEAS